MRRSALTALTAAAALTTLIGLAGPAAAGTVTAGTKATAAQEARVLLLVNQARAKAHCPALKSNAALTKAARGHSVDMATRTYFAHDTPAGVTPWTRIARAGYPKATLAENIAAGQTSADAVVKAWLNSPAHRKNIMNCGLRSAGTGLARGGAYGWYWTQDFGSK